MLAVGSPHSRITGLSVMYYHIVYTLLVYSNWVSPPLTDDSTSFSHSVQMLAVSLLCTERFINEDLLRRSL